MIDRAGADAETLAAHAARMERMYRPQRHLYDITRRYYLLGRDTMLAGVKPTPGQVVLEIGCGTGRNLIWLATRHPDVHVYGVDASAAMLDSARAAIARHHLEHRVSVARDMAETVDLDRSFNLSTPPDHVIFSYALSMIGQWPAALDRAFALLNPHGSLHIVDFGDMGDLPAWFRRGLTHWLSAFGVHHRPEILDALRQREAQTGAHVDIRTLWRGYAWMARAAGSSHSLAHGPRG